MTNFLRISDIIYRLRGERYPSCVHKKTLGEKSCAWTLVRTVDGDAISVLDDAISVLADTPVSPRESI